MKKVTEADDSAFTQTMSSIGLTKREYFAAVAMQGLLANNMIFNSFGKETITKSILTEIAVISADALINSLNKEKDATDKE
jgi:methyl coenzyme M reductase beta subunit